MTVSMLQVNGLETFYGASQALFGMSFEINQGEVVTLLGRNGMGKTTTVHSIMGIVPWRTGQLHFAGHNLSGLPAYKIAQLGLGLVPEGRQIFPNLNVAENLIATAANHAGHASPWTLARIFELFPALAERKTSMGNLLSGGEQQMLAIARILRTGSRFLLLDEPSEGLAPVVVKQIGALILSLKKQGFTILLVEQNLKFARSVADRFVVVEHGEVVDRLAASELEANMGRVQTYLGV
ncbi:MAG: ABC transporter ATP-binding protein [Anaerolineales bacterium]|nr:ABC transporter ATP-binding protein [Anaerolineales bacterium]